MNLLKMLRKYASTVHRLMFIGNGTENGESWVPLHLPHLLRAAEATSPGRKVNCMSVFFWKDIIIILKNKIETKEFSGSQRK